MRQPALQPIRVWVVAGSGCGECYTSHFSATKLAGLTLAPPSMSLDMSSCNARARAICILCRACAQEVLLPALHTSNVSGQSELTCLQCIGRPCQLMQTPPSLRVCPGCYLALCNCTVLCLSIADCAAYQLQQVLCAVFTLQSSTHVPPHAHQALWHILRA